MKVHFPLVKIHSYKEYQQQLNIYEQFYSKFPLTLRLYALTGNKVLHFQTCIAKTAQSMSQSFHSKACTQTSMQCTSYNLHFMDGDHEKLAGIACFILQEKILFWPCNKSFINCACPSLFGQDGWIYIGLIFFKWTFPSSLSIKALSVFEC